MSGNDTLDRAVKALRETGDTSAADVARTRMRMMETLHRGERRGRRTFWVLLPIAAMLAGGAAFAKDSDVVRRVWTGVAETVGIVAAPEKSPMAVRPTDGEGARVGSSTVAAPVTQPTQDVPSTAPVETAAPVEIAPRSRESASSPESLTVAPRRTRGADGAERMATRSKTAPLPEAVEPEAAGTATVAANDGEATSLELYKDAYRLHFVEQRYADALTAWDAYLRAAPAGRLVVEARYNRAIALVRLGRRNEAENALAPFARGEISGGYRAKEAQELLDALNGSSR